MKLKHLEETKLTYFSHFTRSIYISVVLFTTSIKSLVHAIYPEVFQTSATDNINYLSNYLYRDNINTTHPNQLLGDQEWINVGEKNKRKKINTQHTEKIQENNNDEKKIDNTVNTENTKEDYELNSLSKSGIKLRVITSNSSNNTENLQKQNHESVVKNTTD